MSQQNEEKKLAAGKALDFIKDGMIVGLGTGSTATFFIEQLAEKIKNEKMQITAVATSVRSEKLGKELGINVLDVDDVPFVDVTIDGADEVDPSFNGIKGGGAALLFEKIVAKISKKNIWIVDESKVVDRLGGFKLPIEVVKFGSQQVFNMLTEMKLSPTWRMSTEVDKLNTDSGNYIIDADVSGVDDLYALAEILDHKTGVVEHGLFLDIDDVLIIGNNDIKYKEGK